MVSGQFLLPVIPAKAGIQKGGGWRLFRVKSVFSSDFVRGFSQARFVVGEFVPDSAGLFGDVVKPLLRVVGVASHDIADSHAYGGNGSADELAERIYVLMATGNVPPTMLEI